MVRAARALRQVAGEGPAGARHSLRARRPSGAPDDRLLLGAIGAAAVEVPRLHRAVHPRRARAAYWRDLEEPLSCRHAAEDRRRRPRRVLQGRYRPRHRRVLQGQRWLPVVRRHGRAPRRVGRTRQHQLPWLRRLGAAAERAGHRGPADAQRAGRLRFLEDSVRQPRPCAPAGGGQEAGLRRPRALVRRPRLPAGTGRAPDLQAVCARTRQADLARQGAARSAARNAKGTGRRRHHLPDRRRQGRDDGLADPVQLPRHGQRYGADRPGLHPAGPRRNVRAARV